MTIREQAELFLKTKHPSAAILLLADMLDEIKCLFDSQQAPSQSATDSDSQ
jgi:hypothetical protein